MKVHKCNIATRGGFIGWRILVLGFALFVSTYSKAQSDTLNLQQAISIAQEHAISKKRTEMEFFVAKNNLAYTLAGLTPQLTLYSTLPNFYKTTSAITQPDGTISFLPISQDNSSVGLSLSQRVLSTNTLLFAETSVAKYSDFTENGIKNYNAIPIRIGIQQPLNAVNHFKWKKKLYALEEQIAKANIDINHAEIASEVTQKYFDLLAAQVNQEIAQTNTFSSEKIWEIAQERDKLGKISKSDLLQLQLGLSSAKQGGLTAKRELIRANAAFKETLGWNLDNDDIYGLKVPEVINITQLNPGVTANKAWQNRPEQKQLDKLLLETNLALEEAKKNHGWQGSLSATFGWVGTGNTFGTSYGIPQVENFVQLTLRVPIIDGGQKKYSTQSALEKQKFVKEENEFVEQSFKQNVRQLVQQYNELKEEVALAKESLELAGERYQISNQRYILNDISITDLSIAFSERDNAWRAYISLLRAYWISQYTLRQLTLEEF